MFWVRFGCAKSSQIREAYFNVKNGVNFWNETTVTSLATRKAANFFWFQFFSLFNLFYFHFIQLKKIELDFISSVYFWLRLQCNTKNSQQFFSHILLTHVFMNMVLFAFSWVLMPNRSESATYPFFIVRVIGRCVSWSQMKQKKKPRQIRASKVVSTIFHLKQTMSCVYFGLQCFWMEKVVWKYKWLCIVHLSPETIIANKNLAWIRYDPQNMEHLLFWWCSSYSSFFSRV